jgi:hypothetical protein
MATAASEKDPFRVRLTKYVPERKTPQSPTGLHPPQHAFLMLNCNEALYGGAAGGGKSDALLMAALQYADVPGYAALILRKTYADLAEPGAIMDRAKSWLLRTDARWSEQHKIFTFPSGARLSFGYLQHSTDRLRYQSAEFQFIAFDELTQFDELDYLYLHSRLRKPENGPLSLVPLRMRAASNPGGPGHHWVRSRFIKREPQQDEDERPAPGERVFIPAKLDDNPSINKASYIKQLQNLDARTRKQYLDGNWDVREAGACFTEFEYEKHTLDGTRPLGSPYPVVRGLDWGHHHMPVLWIEVQHGQAFVFDEWHGEKTTTPDAASPIRHIDADHGLDTEQTITFYDPAGLGTNLTTGVSEAATLEAAGIPMAHQEERYSPEYRTGLIKTMLEHSNLFISRDRCPYLIECLERAVWDKVGVDGALKDAYKKDGKYDHHLDALGEALARVFPADGPPSAAETAVSAVGPWTPGYYSQSEFG